MAKWFSLQFSVTHARGVLTAALVNLNGHKLFVVLSSWHLFLSSRKGSHTQCPTREGFVRWNWYQDFPYKKWNSFCQNQYCCIWWMWLILRWYYGSIELNKILSYLGWKVILFISLEICTSTTKNTISSWILFCVLVYTDKNILDDSY